MRVSTVRFTATNIYFRQSVVSALAGAVHNSQSTWPHRLLGISYAAAVAIVVVVVVAVSVAALGMRCGILI